MAANEYFFLHLKQNWKQTENKRGLAESVKKQKNNKPNNKQKNTIKDTMTVKRKRANVRHTQETN